jgi:hypothetical protein
LLQEAVFEDVDVTSGSIKEVATGLIGRLGSGRVLLSSVLEGGEHVLWSVHIGSEREVVDLTLVALVEVFADDQVEDMLFGGMKAEVLEHSLELLGGNVA